MDVLVIHNLTAVTESIQQYLTRSGNTCYVMDSADTLLNHSVLFPCDIIFVDMGQLSTLTHSLGRSLFKPYIIGIASTPNPEWLMIAASNNVSDILQIPFREPEISECLDRATHQLSGVNRNNLAH